MESVKGQPLNGLDKSESEAEDSSSHMSRRSRADQGTTTAWFPAVDILESGDAYLIRVELPGLKQEDIHLEFREGMITLSGERKVEVPADGVEYVRAERTVGSFSRKFSLPSTIKQEDIQAAYRDGILEIHIPKSDDVRSKRIAIKMH